MVTKNAVFMRSVAFRKRLYAYLYKRVACGCLHYSGFSAPIQRETKMFLGADNEETAKLTVPMYDFGDWASRMKAYRKKNHITQQELAQLMGVKHFTLRSWEQKQTKPPYHVWRLHKHLFDNSIKLT